VRGREGVELALQLLDATAATISRAMAHLDRILDQFDPRGRGL
jgi:hypothetical protein